MAKLYEIDYMQIGERLKSIRERISELNGTVFFKSKINEGFFTKIIIPREKEK